MSPSRALQSHPFRFGLVAAAPWAWRAAQHSVQAAGLPVVEGWTGMARISALLAALLSVALLRQELWLAERREARTRCLRAAAVAIGVQFVAWLNLQWASAGDAPWKAASCALAGAAVVLAILELEPRLRGAEALLVLVLWVAPALIGPAGVVSDPADRAPTLRGPLSTAETPLTRWIGVAPIGALLLAALLTLRRAPR